MKKKSEKKKPQNNKHGLLSIHILRFVLFRMNINVGNLNLSLAVLWVWSDL